MNGISEAMAVYLQHRKVKPTVAQDFSHVKASYGTAQLRLPIPDQDMGKAVTGMAFKTSSIPAPARPP
jgi:hypothetical protein